MKRQKKSINEKRHLSLIRECVRNIINENAGILNEEDVALINIDSYKKYTIIYFKSQLEQSLSGTPGLNCVISGVEYTSPNTSSDGPCNNAYVVSKSTTSIKEWGRKAYLAAIYHISKETNSTGGLTSSRHQVKPGAVIAWQRLAPKLNAKPFDDKLNPKTPDPNDDCFVFKDKPFLNSSYTLDGAPEQDILDMITRGEEHFTKLREDGLEKQAINLLINKFINLFAIQYWSN